MATISYQSQDLEFQRAAVPEDSETSELFKIDTLSLNMGDWMNLKSQLANGTITMPDSDTTLSPTVYEDENTACIYLLLCTIGFLGNIDWTQVLLALPRGTVNP